MKKQKLNYILEQVRKKGRNGDTILAHINPLEAKMLKRAGGSGTINPKTGLPEFGLISNPKKWFKSVIGSGVGAVVGNMLVPGLGGVIGGAAGGAFGSKVRGRKDAGQAALRGAAMGAMLPTAAGLAGIGANAIGAKGAGHALTKYSNVNALLPSIGLGDNSNTSMYGGNAIMSKMYGANSNGSALENYNRDHMSGVGAGDDYDDDLSFTDKLGRNTKNFLTKPKNLLSLGTTGLTLYDRINPPKPKKELTATQRGKASKEEMLAARLTPAEMAEQEQYELAMEQARRRNSRKKFIPEERIDIEPLYNRVSSPQEYAQSGRWINYYNNPNFTGQPIRF